MTLTVEQAEPLDSRSRAMLKAVSDGRGELICSCEPDLLVDGCPVCDQFTAHRLTASGLIRPVRPGAVGQRVRAELSSIGIAILRGAA